MVWQSIFDVASSLWLVVDMALDCVTTAGFYSKAQNAAKDNIYGAAEFPFFVASIIALFFPTLIGGILLWCYMSYYAKKVTNVKLGWIGLDGPLQRLLLLKALFLLVYISSPLYSWLRAHLGCLTSPPLHPSSDRYVWSSTRWMERLCNQGSCHFFSFSPPAS